MKVRKIYVFLMTALVSTLLMGQSPNSFKYQAVLRNIRGDVRANADVTILIQVTKNQGNGVVVYSESHKVKTDIFGLIDLEIGKGTPITGDFSTINWGNGTYFVNISVDGILMGTTQLHSVPYSLYAEKAGNGFSGDYNDLINKPLLFDGTWLSLTGKPVLASVATSGSYNDLTNKPVLFSGAWASLTGKPTYAVVATTGNYNDLLNKPALFNGTWTSLTAKPTTIGGFGITDAVTIYGDQSISGNKTFTGVISASNKSIKNVATPINNTDAVNKAYVDALMEKIEQLQAEAGVNDNDGNHYKSVKIGNQVWMAENLRSTHYSDGTTLIDGSGAGNTEGNNTSKYYFNYNNDVSNIPVYGRLYTWSAAMNGSSADPNSPVGVQGICPTGWHLPSFNEWMQLAAYLGGDNVAGGQLKEAGTVHWSTPNTEATNNSGFDGLPGGQRGNTSFTSLGTEGLYWLSADGVNPQGTQIAWYGYLNYNNTEGKIFGNFKNVGNSVRCVKDGISLLPSVSTTAVSGITNSSALSGGNVTSDGGVTITARGICWSTNENPTITLITKTANSSGIGDYTSPLTGLAENTTYYIRAYATNNAGTVYGNQVSFTTSSVMPLNGLVAYYPFNGNANDEGVNANHGIVTGATLTTNRKGAANKAYYFDGTSNYIKITGGLPITNSFTISFWAFCEDASNYNNVICDGSSQDGGNDFLINFRSTSIGIRADKNNLPLNYEDSYPAALSNLDIINKWVNVVWVMDPASSKIYLNGELISTINQAGTNEGHHDAFSFIGARQVWGNPDYFFKGKLDDIMIYNKPLTQAEITTLYNQ